MDNSITIFGETNFRNERKRFGIKPDDRRRHMYIIGKTGMGKTEMLANMTIQDIRSGGGVAVIDPHGEYVERMLDFVPKERVNDVVYINPADIDNPIAFNVMEQVSPEFRHLVASGVMGVFKKIWVDVWSARMEYILNNTILALLEVPDSTLLGINRMLSDKDYRKTVVDQITDPVVKAFWTQEYARYQQRYEVEATAAIQNKVGQFISAPLIRNIIGQPRSKLDMRAIMDERKILLVNLSKGKVGEDNSRLLGALVITKLQLAAMSRVDMPEDERRDFYLYVDEFQNFATESFASILSEARKYRLNLILAHQYIAQMDEKVRDATFGNVGTLVSFRVGADDAEFLEKEFAPEFSAQDLVNLPKYNIYLKLMIDGIASRAFSSTTLAPFSRPDEQFKNEIIKQSQVAHASSRSDVEKMIAVWTGVAPAGEEMTASQTVFPGGTPPLRERRDKRPESPLTKSLKSRESYDAVCDRCGNPTTIFFKPDGERPVYCQKCLGEVRKEKQVAQNLKKTAEEGRVRGAPKVLESSVPPTSLKALLQGVMPERHEASEPPKQKQEQRTKKLPNLSELRSLLEGAVSAQQEKEHNEAAPKVNSAAASDKGKLKEGERVRFE